MRSPLPSALFVVLAVTAGFGCAQLSEEMHMAERAYEQARYEESLVWLESLEGDTPDMDASMRARFYFLRGMTAYRLGHRGDALHYLALARELSGNGERQGTLREDWREHMDRTLAELTPQTATFRPREAPTAGGEAITPAPAAPQAPEAEAPVDPAAAPPEGTDGEAASSLD